MKKILGTTLVAMVLASGVMAGGAYIKGGVYNTEANLDTNPSTTGYEVGFGGHGHFDEAGNILFGGELNYGYQYFDLSSGATSEMSFYGGELHLGYTFIDDLDVFGIVGYYGNSIEYVFSNGSVDNLTGSGVRYGVGIDYRVWKHLSLGAEYTVTNFDMYNEVGASVGDFDLTNIGVNVKLHF